MKNRIVKSLIAFILISLMMLPSGGLAVLAAEASADLVGISVGNLSIADFDASVTSYDVKVPYTYTPNSFTTVATPTVKAYAADPNATVTVTQPASADGTATIVVENEGNSKTYTVNLSTAAMNLAADGGMEDGTWTSYNRNNIGFGTTRNTSHVKAGGYSLEYSVGAWGSVSLGMPSHTANVPVAYNPNIKYLLTYWVSSPANNGAAWQYAANRSLPGDNVAVYYNEDGTTTTSDSIGKLTSDWTRVVQTHTSATGNTSTNPNAAVRFQAISAAATTLIMDEYYFAPLAVTDIEYNGETSVAIPTDAAKSITVSAKLKNQIGGSQGLENETVSYRLLSAPDGVTLDGTTLTVGTDAKEGKALIEISSALSFTNGFQTKVASIEEVSIYSLENENLPKLSGIVVGNLSIPDFNPKVTSYDVKVPYSYIPNNFTTVATPVIKAYAEDPEAQISITQPQSADGRATITVTKGDYSRTYTVNLSGAAMNLAADGGFENGTAYEWIRWTLGFVCSVTDTKPYAGSKTLNHSNTVWDPVRVYAEDSATVKGGATYLVTYVARDVNNSGVSWYASNSGTYTSKKYYNEDGSERSGDYLGKLSDEYSRIIQTYVPSADAKVNSLAYGPITMGAANPIEIDEMLVAPLAVTDIAYTGDKKVYIPEDGENTGVVSAKLINQIGGSQGLENETVSYRLISAPEGVSLNGTTLTVGAGASEGTALIEMTSTLSFDNGFQTKVSSIEEITVSVDNRAEVAEALDIQVGKLSIPDFDSKTTEYDMVVPYSYKENNFDTPSVPRVRVIPRNSEAEITVDYPEAVENGVVTVTITSGEYTKVYTINLSYAAVNEAVDGGMEEGDWVALNSDTVGMVFGGLTPDMKKAGDRSYEFYLKSAWGQLMINPENGFTMSPDVKYLLSYYLRAKEENFTVYASNDKLPSDKVVKHYNDDGSAKGGDNAALTTTDWTHIIQTYSSATGGEGARFAPTGTANKSMYMDEYYYAPLTATDIVLTGTKYIEKLESGSQSIPLTAKVINQLGGTHGLENETVTFELVGDYEGVTLSGNTLTITSDAPIGSVPVRAKSTFKNGLQQNVWDIVEFDIIDNTADLTINLSKAEIAAGEIEASIFTKGIGKNLTLYIALYEETEKGHVLADVDNAEASLAADGVIKARVYVDVPDDGKDYTIKCFLWDENLGPVVTPEIIE